MGLKKLSFLAAVAFFTLRDGVCVKKLFDLADMFKQSPVKCLPLIEQKTFSSIQKQDTCKVEKSADKFVLTSNADSICQDSCTKKSELLATIFNSAFTQCIALIHKIYYDKSDEGAQLKDDQRIKFVPNTLESKCSKKGTKYLCNCSFNLNFYGSENVQTIIRRAVKEMLKQKPEVFYNNAYLKHLYKTYKLEQHLTSLRGNKSGGQNGNRKVQKKSVTPIGNSGHELQRRSSGIRAQKASKVGGQDGNQNVHKKSVAVVPIWNSEHELQRRSSGIRGQDGNQNVQKKSVAVVPIGNSEHELQRRSSGIRGQNGSIIGGQDGNQNVQKKSVAVVPIGNSEHELQRRNSRIRGQNGSQNVQKKSVAVVPIGNSGHKLQRRSTGTRQQKTARLIAHASILMGSILAIWIMVRHRFKDLGVYPLGFYVLGWCVLAALDLNQRLI